MLLQRRRDTREQYLRAWRRIIRSNDGINWETAGLFESETGDIRDPRLSVTTDGQLMLNGSIAFIEDVAPYQVIDGQTVMRQSVTWLSFDGTTWSGPYSCPTGINTCRWDMPNKRGFVIAERMLTGPSIVLGTVKHGNI